MKEEQVFEDDLDALRATVQALGGNKIVGALLWPDKTPEGAGRSMADCCNPSRSERLNPSQLLFLMRMARERGWSVVRWITADDNYRGRGVYDRVAKRTMWITYDRTP
jgi:hypothetical protein